MTGGIGGTDLHEFVPEARKSRIDDHGALPGAVRLNRNHPLDVGLTNVFGGGVYLVGGQLGGAGNWIAASMES